MKTRHPLKALSETAAGLFRAVVSTPASPSVTSLTNPRKLTPIEEVVARAGREPALPPD